MSDTSSTISLVDSLRPEPSRERHANGATRTAQSLRSFQARLSMIDRTDFAGLTDAAIDDALAYIEVTPDIQATADKAKAACRRFKKAFETPYATMTPRRRLLERARQRAQCRVTELADAIRDARDSWVAEHVGDA